MDLLQTAMKHHLGRLVLIFIAATLFLFSFSTFRASFMRDAMYIFRDNYFTDCIQVLVFCDVVHRAALQHILVWGSGDVEWTDDDLSLIIIFYPQGEKA